MKIVIYILDRFLEQKKLTSSESEDVLYLQNLTEDSINFSSSENDEGSIFVEYNNLPTNFRSLFVEEVSGVNTIQLRTSFDYVIKSDYFNRQYDIIFDAVKSLYFIEVAFPTSKSSFVFKKLFIKPNEIKSDDNKISSYVFDVNPSEVNPSYKKLVTETRTSGGWNIQQWGNDLPVISFSGISKSLMQKDKKKSEMDITSSEVWKNLIKLKNLYLESSRSLKLSTTFGISYYDSFFTGYFIDFQGPEIDVDSPFRVKYSFKFKVSQEIHSTTYVSEN